MIHRQANALNLLVLSGATLFCLLLECRADNGGRAKRQWLAECEQQLGSNMVGKVTPEDTAEILKQLQKTMPHDDFSEDWLHKRHVFSYLIDAANVDEKCLGKGTFQQYELGIPKYALLRGGLPDWALLRDYPEHFKNKQVNICVAKINEQLEKGLVKLNEDDKRDIEALMSQIPQLQASDNLEWDKWEAYAVIHVEQLFEAIYRFLEANAGPLSEKIVRPNRRTKFQDFFRDRMKFCHRIEVATKDAVDKYLTIRYYGELVELASQIEPDTLKWIKAAKVCRQLRINYRNAVATAYSDFMKTQPSRASLVLNCFKPKNQAS